MRLRDYVGLCRPSEISSSPRAAGDCLTVGVVQSGPLPLSEALELVPPLAAGAAALARPLRH